MDAHAKSSHKTTPGGDGKGGRHEAGKPALVRDSFTFPECDYSLIAEIKERALKAGCAVKKSEILRAGLAVLARMPVDELLAALDTVERIKTGRPSGSGEARKSR